MGFPSLFPMSKHVLSAYYMPGTLLDASDVTGSASPPATVPTGHINCITLGSSGVTDRPALPVTVIKSLSLSSSSSSPLSWALPFHFSLCLSPLPYL